jgi:hypothetical protein
MMIYEATQHGNTTISPLNLRLNSSNTASKQEKNDNNETSGEQIKLCDSMLLTTFNSN